MFPLLKLPFLCIQAVLQNTSPRDLIHFSLASKKSYRLLKLIKSSVKKINFNGQEGSIYFLDFNEKWLINVGDIKEQATVTVNMNGNEAKWFITDSQSYIYTHQSVCEFLKYAVPYLLDIFNCEIHHCLFAIDQIPSLTEISCFGFTKCQHIILEGEREVRDKEMLSVIQKMTATKISLAVNLNEFFYCNPELFNTEHLGLGKRSAKWLTCDTFLRLQRIPDIRMFDPRNSPLMERDFIAFISQWYHSDNRQFRQLAVCVPWRLSPHFLERFQPTRYDSKERGPVFPCNGKGINSVDGRDILRSDGLLATVYQRLMVVYFYVWHERFPNLGDIAII